ncbi:MAG: transglutaminase-like domain-containing protein [Lachnospiraceae bacterium]|nr:transglutaminase-like domain-containing protein [Lachnospiraceae bacterium]
MKEMIYDALYLIPFSLIAPLWTLSYRKTDAPMFWCITVCIVIPILGTLFLHIRNSGKIILGGVIISILSVSLLLFPADSRSRFLSDNPWLLSSVMITLASFVIGSVLCSFRLSRTLLAVLLIILLAVSVPLGTVPDKVTVSSIFFFILCTTADEIQLRWIKAGDTEHRAHLVFISPFLALILILMLIFPVSDEPYDWAIVKKICQTAAERFDRVVEFVSSLNGSDSAEKFMGFSENAVLNSNTGGNDKKVLEIIFGAGSGDTVYLAGKSFDTFNGSKWEKDYKTDQNDTLLDSLETLSSVKEYSGEDLNDYIKRTNVIVELQNIHSSHIFIPGKYYRIEPGLKKDIIIPKDGDLFFNKRKARGYRYTVDYFRLNTDNQVFEGYLHNIPDIDRESWEKALASVNISGTSDVGYDDYISYKNRIYENYIHPVTFSPKLSAYMDGLLEGCQSDIEKLQRIEEFLSSMNYSTDPGAIPKHVDTPEKYLDHFIFEKQSGHCVYYATAFVLLAWGEGIPARFVQGYRVTSNKQHSTIVTERYSHAWPECYIENVGWIMFEPTPGYKKGQSWKTADELKTERENYAAQKAVPYTQNEIELPEKIEEEHSDERRPDFKKIVIIVSVSLIVAIILFVLDILYGTIRYRIMDDERKLKILFKRNMNLLGILGLKKSESETYEEFSGRCGPEIPSELIVFIPSYELYAYRNDPVDKNTISIFENNNRELISFIKQSGIRNRLALLRYYLFSL